MTVTKGFPVICMAYNFFVMPDQWREGLERGRGGGEGPCGKACLRIQLKLHLKSFRHLALLYILLPQIQAYIHTHEIHTHTRVQYVCVGGSWLRKLPQFAQFICFDFDSSTGPTTKTISIHYNFVSYFTFEKCFPPFYLYLSGFSIFLFFLFWFCFVFFEH